jgi:hypothetical protein
MKGSGVDNPAIVVVLVFHLAWILWVIFGAFWTRSRRWLSVFHIASLVWGILVEVGPWPCPLTMAEDSLQRHAGMASSQGTFLQYYLSLIVYPNVSEKLIVVCGVAVCFVNLLIYAGRAFHWICRPPSIC